MLLLRLSLLCKWQVESRLSERFRNRCVAFQYKKSGFWDEITVNTIPLLQQLVCRVTGRFVSCYSLMGLVQLLWADENMPFRCDPNFTGCKRSKSKVSPVGKIFSRSTRKANTPRVTYQTFCTRLHNSPSPLQYYFISTCLNSGVCPRTPFTFSPLLALLSVDDVRS